METTYTISHREQLMGGVVMNLDSIGKRIRQFRVEKKMRQEDLAEKTGLSANYIGMVERSEKIPSLETFIHIANALSISADMLLVDVLDTGYVVKNSLFSDKISKLPANEREKIYAVIDTMITHSSK